MRSLPLLSLVCSGCIISEPSGATQTWAPVLGTNVEAVVAGDLDGNGSSDIVVFGSGDDNQAGMFHLVAGRDLVYGTSEPVRSFSRFIPTELGSPVHATYLGRSDERLMVVHADVRLRVSFLDGNLEQTDFGLGDIDAGGSVVWAREVMFPGGVHTVISDGSQIEHFDPGRFSTEPLPPPAGPMWQLAQVATSYVDPGGEHVIAVATPDAIYRAVLPDAPGQTLTWQTARAAGVATGGSWLGQIAYDLDGDGREEILGFELATHRLCAFDPADDAPMPPACLDLPSDHAGTEVTIIAGKNLSPNAGPDILIAQASGSDTRYTVVEDFTYVPGALSATNLLTPPVAGPARGRTVAATGAPGTPHSVLTFGTDGAVACVFGPC